MHYDGSEYSTVSERLIRFLLLVTVVWEKLIQFANWWWTSILGTVLSLVACAIFTTVCYDHAATVGANTQLYSWLTIAALLGTTVSFLACLNVLLSSKYNFDVTQTTD